LHYPRRNLHQKRCQGQNDSHDEKIVDRGGAKAAALSAMKAPPARRRPAGFFEACFAAS
jgi:hypothetical protein